MLGLLVALSATVRVRSLVAPTTQNWDENTFILVAQRLGMGELPFTTTFENKPPLLPILQSVPLLLAPGSLHLFRLTLVVVVALTAFAVFEASTRVGLGRIPAIVAACGFIVWTMASPSGTAWMSQHSANLWLAVLLLLTVRGANQRSDLLITGLVAAVLVLTRTNYVVPAAALLALAVLWTRDGRRLRSIWLMTVGGLLPAASVTLVYSLAGELGSLRAGVLDVILTSGGQGDVRTGLGAPPRWFIWALLTGLALQLAGTRGSSSRSDAGRRLWWANLSMLLGLAASILLHGTIFSHYLLMFALPLGIGFGLALDRILHDHRAAMSGQADVAGRHLAGVAGRGAALIVAVLLLEPSGMAAGRLLPSRTTTEAVFEAELTAALAERLDERPGTVWALDHHFVYWRTRTLPPHPLVTHPSSLSKPEFWASVPIDGASRPSTGREAVGLVLATSPDYVVSSEGLTEWYLRRFDDDATALLLSVIEEEYRVVWRSSINNAVIRTRHVG